MYIYFWISKDVDVFFFNRIQCYGIWNIVVIINRIYVYVGFN